MGKENTARFTRVGERKGGENVVSRVIGKVVMKIKKNLCVTVWARSGEEGEARLRRERAGNRNHYGFP